MAKSKRDVKFQHQQHKSNGTVKPRTSSDSSAFSGGDAANDESNGALVTGNVSRSVSWGWLHLTRSAERTGTPSIGLSEEEAVDHNENNMDLYHVRSLLWRHVRWSHIHDHDRDGDPNHLIQRSHGDIKRAESCEESTIHQNTELVFLGDYHVFPLWGERGLLL